MATLLCYNLTGDRAAKIKFTAMRLKIRICEVSPEDYYQPLAALCGRAPRAEADASAESFTDEMLVMADFSNSLITQFLQAFRNGKIPPVLLKAILTDVNAGWTSLQLHRELSAEREAVLAQGKPMHQQTTPAEER